MSALPPKADIIPHCVKCPLLAKSGHCQPFQELKHLNDIGSGQDLFEVISDKELPKKPLRCNPSTGNEGRR